MWYDYIQKIRKDTGKNKTKSTETVKRCLI